MSNKQISQFLHRHGISQKWQQFTEGLSIYWFRTLALALTAFLLLHKDLSFEVNLSGAQTFAMSQLTGRQEEQSVVPITQSILPFDLFDHHPNVAKAVTTEAMTAKMATEDPNLGNTYSNMTFAGNDNISQKAKAAALAKKKKQEAYVKRFAEIAQTEMHKYGIPASIKLAQGLIESNAGDSRLSVNNNNHFGMKCFSRKCKKGHCSNFTDDSHKDFFRVYSSAWESYRAHSIMLNGDRYRHLQKLGKDYKSWAKGLKKAGYATDKQYAEKLIQLIEDLHLDRFDQ